MMMLLLQLIGAVVSDTPAVLSSSFHEKSDVENNIHRTTRKSSWLPKIHDIADDQRDATRYKTMNRDCKDTD